MSKFLTAILSLATMGYLFMTQACSPQACFEETNAFVKASFYDNIKKNPKAPDSLTVYGLGKDTLRLYNKERGIQPALFPLNDSTENCTFIVRINGVNDTITFRYSSYPHLVSKECGYTFYHNIENIDSIDYTRNMIDYIYTGSKNITTSNEENIRIFF